MGAEREDTDPTPAKGGTEPGLGPGSVKTPAAAPPPLPRRAANGAAEPAPAPAAAAAPEPVDFDALHAALGAPEADIPVTASSMPPAGGGPNRVGESLGRSSASYASARPHTLPPRTAASDSANVPAVIVAVPPEDTVPSAPPQMTVPLGAPGSAPQTPAAAPASGPHAASVPSSGNHPAAPQPSYPYTPQPFPVQRLAPNLTMKMPERPRRPRTPTVVVRSRGPSAKQKLVAFMAMLVLVTACGVAVIIWRQPGWLGLEPPPTASAAPTGVKVVPVPPSAVAAPALSTSATVAPTAKPVAPEATSAAPAPAPPPTSAPKGKPPRRR